MLSSEMNEEMIVNENTEVVEENKMGVMPINKLLVSMSLPMIISMLVQALYNVVDSFDTHARIPEHFENVDNSAKAAGKTCVISCGWDPGMFSLNRLYANCILPDGKDYTFWGKGVSQGHSDAVRRIEGN